MANPDERLIPLEGDADSYVESGLFRFLNKMNIYLNKGLAWVAGTSLLLMVLVVVANVTARVVYKPFIGTSELVGWLAAVTLAFGLGFTQLQQGYVEIDALVERFPLMLQRIIKGIILLISTCFFAMVAWQMIGYAQNVAANGNVSETMKIPFYPLIYLLAVGFGGLSLALAVDFVKELMGRGCNE